MIWGRPALCNGCARSGFASNSSGFALQSREEAQKYINVECGVMLVRVCFNVRQTRARVLHAEPALGPGENALLSAEGADAATQIAPSAEGAEAATQIAPSAEGAEAATQIAPSAEG